MEEGGGETEARLSGERLPQCGVGSGWERAAESCSVDAAVQVPLPALVGAIVRGCARANANAARGS